MGSGPSVLTTVLDLPPVATVSLTLDDVTRLHETYRDGYYDFGLTLEALQQLLEEASLKNIPASKLYDVFDPERTGLVNSLEVLAVLGLLSGAGLTEKIAFIVTVYDLQGANELSYDETVVMSSCTLSGLVRVYRSPEARYPEDTEMEHVADEIFLSCDRDVAANVPTKAAASWILNFLSTHLEKDLDIGKVLALFGLLNGTNSRLEDEGPEEHTEDPLESILGKASLPADKPAEIAQTAAKKNEKPERNDANIEPVKKQEGESTVQQASSERASEIRPVS